MLFHYLRAVVVTDFALMQAGQSLKSFLPFLDLDISAGRTITVGLDGIVPCIVVSEVY